MNNFLSFCELLFSGFVVSLWSSYTVLLQDHNFHIFVILDLFLAVFDFIRFSGIKIRQPRGELSYFYFEQVFQRSSGLF